MEIVAQHSEPEPMVRTHPFLCEICSISCRPKSWLTWNSRAALAAYATEISSETVDLALTFRQIASLIQNTMGGTSGAIYAIFFNAVSTYLDKSTGGGGCYSTVMAAALQSGLTELCKYTSARVGSRTLMDALIPAVAALHKDDAQDLQAAVAAARRGAESTRRMDAKLGRASYVAKEQLSSETGGGVPDPGALGVVSILEGVAAGLVRN